MSLAADSALANPAQAVKQLYAANKAQGIDTFPKTVADYFRNILPSRKIPTLDLIHPPESFGDGELVTFSCMVQDTSLSPELYVSDYGNGHCGGWGITADATSGGTDVAYENLRECTVVWAVSIPGLSSWDQDVLSSTNATSSAQPHKFPIPNAPHIGVQVKIYDDNIAKSLRTTDLISFTGILTTEPLHSAIDIAEPPSVPTLHVLFLDSIPQTIFPRSYPDTSLIPTVNTLRADLISWIADESLGGDCGAAEWILLCSIARVRSRHPPVLPLSLTIANFPSHSEDTNATPTLCHILSLLFPLVSIVNLSLETLNKWQYCPESKEEDLHSGLLQLPKGSMLIFNEGAVTEGGLVGKGLMNIRAAQEVMQAQTLEYAFPYSSFNFDTDTIPIIIANGKKSTFFQTDVVIPLHPTSANRAYDTFYKPVAAIKLPPLEKLQKFRHLVGAAKIGNVAIGEETAKHIEDDFVRERTASSKDTGRAGSGLTSDDLIRRMLISRLQALSLHQTEVTAENWECAKLLDEHLRR